MGTSRISLNILYVLFVISVLWKPALTEDKCSAGCKGSSSSPTFLNGHKYNYGVEGSVSIYLTGADRKETNVKLLGQVSVSALGNCAYVLKVQNLVISGPDGKKYNKPSGLDKPVRFTLQDGRVGSEICSEEGDTRRSLNIKRAIISLLQTEQKPSTQVDVFGTCPTDVSSSQEGGALLVHRTRDLSRCAHREQGKNDLITGIVNPSAEIKDSQVLQSILNIESKVNHGVPEKVAATEEYLYRPFSVGENGARAKVNTKLTLTGKAGGADSGNFKEVHTIIFEIPHGVVSETSNLQSAINIVKETAKTLGSEASSKSAGKFAQVVRVLRTTSKDDLLKVYNQCRASNIEKRVFLDGLLRAGTGASIEASIQILKSKELSPIEQELVFLSLGNARHVTNEALKAAAGLLDLPNLPKETYLGVGALAGVYCAEHSCHVVKPEGIVALSNKLGAKLQNCKPKTKTEEDNVVAVLKGIRNINHLEDNLIDKVIHCAVDNTVKKRIRAAALEAFQADPCAAKLKKTGLDLLKNRQQDSEIRIKAYLAVIACPCGKSANEIKNLLETEPVHQVGRFITTSLRHIRSSANPDKRLARQHYGLIRTPSRFNVDDRKYSYYREASFNVDALGVGGTVEETVIYSQDSFLPRSATLNLTAELFGHNLNVLELGGRQGNLDRVVEHFLGPKGLLRTENPQALYDDIVKRFQEAEKKIENSLSRGRRSVKAEIDNFDKHIKAESTPYNNELDLDLYLKLFGTDAVFLSLGDDKGFDFNNLIDQILKTANDGINKVKRFQQEIRANLLFLDAELAYPTSTGLPLKLDLVGSATARVDLSTNVDIRQCIRSPQNAKLDIKLVPSTDIEIAGYFLVDADAVATGLKVVTNLHSSTGGHLIAKVIENGHGIDLQFALPIDKQEIVTASNDLVYVIAEKGQAEKELAIKVDSERKEYSGCFDQLSGVLGLTLCGEVSVPFSVSGPEAQASISKYLARYPLTGASKVKLVLEKNDLKGYRLKGVIQADNPERRTFDLLFEAEGSKNRRTHLYGEVANTEQEKTLKLNLESPIKNVGGQVSLYTKPNEYVALVKFNLDAIQYYGRVGFNVQGNQQRSVFKPVVEYELPDDHGKQSLKVDGQLIREINGPATKYTFEGIKVNLPNSNEVVDVNGHFKQEPKNLDLEVKARKGQHNLLLSGALKGNDLKLEFQNTLNPYINFKAAGHSEFGETIHNSLDVYYSGDLRNSQNRVTVKQFLKYNKKSEKDYGVITKNEFVIHAIPFKAKLEADVDPKKVDIEIEGQYQDKKAEFDLEARTQIKKQGDYSVKLVADVDKKGFEVVAKRDIVSPDKSNLENYIVVKGVGRYELSGVVLHKNKPNDINVGAIGHLKISGGGKNEDIKFDIGAIENSRLYSSHAKISCSQGELLDFLLKLTKGANADGQLKLILKDTIAANGQFKVTDNDGKGNGLIIVDLKKIQRKIKGDVKFVVKDPVYNADIDLYLNFEKDNNDKISINTNTRRTEKLLESKNKIEYGGKKAELNVHQDGIFDLQGKGNSVVEIVLPTERCLSLKYNRDISVKDDVINGQAEVILSDAAKRGGQASTISYKGKLINTNYEKDIIDYEGQVDLKLKDGKNLQNVFVLKNTPGGGDKSKFEFKSDVTGNLITKPASLVANVDYINSDFDVYGDYRVKGSYGGDVGFELLYKSEIKLFEAASKKLLDDTILTLRLPFEKAHDLKFVSTYLYLENKDVVEYTVVQSAQINADLYKIDASGKLGLKDGSNKIKVLVPRVDPVTIDVNYKGNLEGERKNANVEVKANYGKGKSATLNAEAVSAPQDYTLAIKANAPDIEKLKKLEVKIHTKKPTPESVNAQILVDADGRVYKSESTVVSSSTNPLIDIKYSSPNNPTPSRIYVKGNYGANGVSAGEVKIENIRGISYDSNVELNIQKDNFVVKGTANCEALKFKNYQVEIKTKDAGSGKRLEFHATNDNKNVLSGSTSYITKQEGPKTIVEGSGTLKVNEDQKSANFKYIRTVLTEGNEQGVETFLNTAIGDRSYVAESRVTNLEYKTSYVYCEEKKQCAHVEFHSKVNIKRPGCVQHLINVGLDLRKLGFAPEFGLQVSKEVSEDKLPQASLDLHINKEEKKYHLHIYEQPEAGRFPVGITITLPHRVLALESLVTYPTNKAIPFPIKGEVSLHLDKNKPQQKTAARFLIDVTGNDKQQNAIAEFGFSHPKLGKEACIKVKGQVQNPQENTLKVESSASISLPSLGDRESKLLLEVSPANIKLLVDTPLVKVIDLEGSTVAKDNLLQGDVKFSLLQSKPVQIRGVIKDFQYYEFTTGYTDQSERKLSIIGRIDPEKRVDVSADIILPGQKKNIAHGAVFLQDNLVKTDYDISKDNVKYFIDALKKDVDVLEDRIKQLGEKASADFKNTLNRVEPTVKQLEAAYKEDLEKLYKEISDDKILQEISHAINDIVQFVAKIVSEIVDVTKPIVDKIYATITETSKKIAELYEKQIEPQLKQLYVNVAAVIKEYFDGLIEIVAHFSALVADFYEKHKAELQELTNTVSEIFKDLTRLVVAQLKEYRIKTTKILEDLTQQIKDLPIVNTIKEKVQELAVPDNVIDVLLKVHNAIRQILPTEETKKFTDALYTYVVKKLRQEKCDDSKELRVLYEKFAVALTSLIQFARAQLNQLGVPALVFNVNSPYLLTGPSQTSVPSFGGSASFSLLNQILKGDVPDPLSLLRAYRPRSLNPLDEVPAKLRAVVVNGQHIFTFDGRHLTFPGNCRYVLAHDHVDRNFTLALALQNGAPKTLILEDKSGSTIELKENGQVALNGANHGFPVIEQDIFAFKQVSGRIGLGSKYGLMAFCTSKLEVCYIEVNGFYLGKLRGLLGDGNNEPYDDFRLPNGKISTSESEFGNAYRLATSCPQVKTPEHSHHQLHASLPQACEQVFGGSSPLRPLELILDAKPFRQACIHACHGISGASALRQACDLAQGYTALAVTGLLPAVLPPVCVQCTDADKPANFGDTYEVNVAKKADIVVGVETTKSTEKNYKELVVPLISQLVDNLKAKHIEDIKVYLVGVTPKFPYPIIYDTDLKLKTPKVQFDDESRTERVPSINTGVETVDKYNKELVELMQFLKEKFAISNVMVTYHTIFDLPLRPGAVKQGIYTVGDKCESRFVLFEIFHSMFFKEFLEEASFNIALVGQTPDLKIGGGKNPTQVVGFTDNSVLLLGDKKQTQESESLRSTLELDKDACVGFTESVGGIVLSSNNYFSCNAGQQKQYLQTAATAITNQLLQGNIVKECTCGYADPFRVRSICVNKEIKAIAGRRK